MYGWEIRTVQRIVVAG